MKKKLLTLSALCLVFFLLFGTFPCLADVEADTAEAQTFLDGIFAFNGVNTEHPEQEWIDGQLALSAGDGSEWYALALTQYGSYDMAGYEKALLDHLNSNTVHSASSRLKFALCLAATGSTDKYINSTLNEAIGKQGLMSRIFGLHLLNNGYCSSEYTASSLMTELLNLRCEDGGWSVTGKTSDVDATAMALQALAPIYQSTSELTELTQAVEQATALLSERQLENGGFSSYGAANPESAAQVLVALSALGIDAKTDTRFIKNGNTIFDAIDEYRLKDGSFSHSENGAYSALATSQVFYASVAYLRMANGSSSLYILDGARPSEAESPTPSDNVGDVDNDNDPQRSEFNTVKLWLCIGISALGIIIAIALYVKRRSFKDIVAITVVTAIAVTALGLADIRSADDYYGSTEKKENVIGTVTLSVRCDTVVGKDANIPSDGSIIETETFEIAAGDTVYTILKEATQKHRISLEKKGTSSGVYISGIGGLYEFDHGELSGWIYFVNGERPSVGAGEYVPSDGDVILWCYTCKLGEDIDISNFQENG